jgi:hypothetical protein
MKKITLASLFFFISMFQLNAQTIDIAIASKKIYALTKKGNIRVFTKSDLKVINTKIINSSKIVSIAIDRKENLIIADEKNEIKRYDEVKDSWKIISKNINQLSSIVFDTNNHCFAITNEGIKDLETHKIYISNKSLNTQIHYNGKWGVPYCCYIDKIDRIWLGFGYGEWGGNIIIFDTKNKKFLTPDTGAFKIELLPIKSFFEDKSSIYFSSGLNHMGVSGAIVRFDDLKASTIIQDESYDTKYTVVGNDTIKSRDADYIGPATFNFFNNSIYFYSQNGILKGEKTKDLSKIENWDLVIKPELTWISGQPDAVGSPMNVLKLMILDEKRFIFLSQNNGIGYYDGTNITMIQ